MLEESALEEFKASLFAGRYNLLLGSGTSLDSFDAAGNDVSSANDLRLELNRLKRVPESTSLARVSNLLEPNETEKYLTQRFLGCKAGKTAKLISQYLWKSAFTFNIDDCLENAYESNTGRLQTLDSVNFDSLFRIRNGPAELQLIHLHGFSRDPGTGYVFSTTQYGEHIKGENSWMHVLTELIATEPFIVAGTTLDEPDFESYLARRSPNTVREGRGPSILIEPYPNPITVDLCKRHDLILVKATCAEFFEWIRNRLGNPPGLADLVIPSNEDIFLPRPSQTELLTFYSTFDLIRPVAGSPADGDISSFFYGRAPTWRDLAANVDVPTDDDLLLGARIRVHIDNPSNGRVIYFLSGQPGSGKSTCVRRTAYELAKDGKIVLSLKGDAVLHIEQLINTLSLIARPFVILIDEAGDHVTLMSALARADRVKKPFVILAADRSYREDHVDRTIGNAELFYYDVSQWRDEQLEQLIERYRQRGFVAAQEAIRSPNSFAIKLRTDVVAVAACRILNDFRPLEVIVRSIWNHATSPVRRTYLAAALAQTCSAYGVSYTVLEATFPNAGLKGQFDVNCPLPLVASSENDEYILPLNSLIADRVLSIAKHEKPEVLLDIFIRLATALAPYVNRRTSIQGTPEARLAGRLFNATKVVGPLLGSEMAASFYESTKSRWEWNSRYWEQRALLAQSTDLDAAVRFARQAVAIEGHPFPWTTLASVLIHKMDVAPNERDSLFDEAYKMLSLTLRREEAHDWRPTAHAYATLFSGVSKFLSSGGYLPTVKSSFVKEQLDKSGIHFPHDRKLQALCLKLREFSALR